MSNGVRSIAFSFIIIAILYLPGIADARSKAASTDGKTSMLCRQQISRSHHLANVYICCCKSLFFMDIACQNNNIIQANNEINKKEIINKAELG